MNRIRGAVSSVANAPTYRFLQAGIFVVLGIAFATSFSSGSSGAEILGYQPAFVASVPLICDIVAALAMVVHGRVRDDRSMRRLAAWFVLVPMLLSWAANALDHLRRTPAQPYWSDWSQWAWIGGVVVFAGLAPVAVAGLLHFMARYVEFEKRVAETAPTPDVRTQPELSQNSVDDAMVAIPAIPGEPEFIEPAPRIPVLFAPKPVAIETEVDAETVKEIDEIEIHRVMRDTKPRVSRDVAEIMVRDKVSRATAYRRAKGAGDAALA